MMDKHSVEWKGERGVLYDAPGVLKGLRYTSSLGVPGDSDGQSFDGVSLRGVPEKHDDETTSQEHV